MDLGRHAAPRTAVHTEDVPPALDYLTQTTATSGCG